MSAAAADSGWTGDFMQSTGFMPVQQANAAQKARLQNQPRGNRPSVGPFVNAYNASAPSAAEQVPGTVIRMPGAAQVVPGMMPEHDAPLLPVSQPLSEPFPVEDVLVNKSGINRTPLTMQKNWQAVSVGRAGLAPTAPSSVFSNQERMRGSRELADVSTNETDVQVNGANANRVASQSSTDVKGIDAKSVFPYVCIACGVLLVAVGLFTMFFRGSSMGGMLACAGGIGLIGSGVYMIGRQELQSYLMSKKQSSPGENLEAAPLSTGWKEPSLTSGKGWDAWPSITGMHGSATLPGTKPIITKKPVPVVTKRPKGKQNLVAESTSWYDMNTPILVAGIDGPKADEPAEFGVIPQRRDQPDADPFRPPPDPMNTFEDRLLFQGTDPNSLEGPRAGVGYQRSPLPEGRKTLPVAALMRAPEDSNMDAPTFAEYMRQLGGELPNQFYQAHPYYTFNAEWDKRTQIDDDQTQFGISSSPDQMNRKFKYKDPRIQQAGAKTSHLKDPPPGAVPPLEKTHPWLERDENGTAPPAALLITPIATEREVAHSYRRGNTVEIEELAGDSTDDKQLDSLGRERIHVPRDAGPPAPIETMSEKKRRQLNPVAADNTRENNNPVPAVPAPPGFTSGAAGGDDDDDTGGGGFLSAFGEKPIASEEAINHAIQLAGRRD